MHLLNFDGFVDYDEVDFQALIADLKTATDAADAAYTALDVDLKAYFALLAFNNLYVIIRDKAHVRAFVQDELKASVKGGGELPEDEIEAAIDALLLGISTQINLHTRQVDGQKPKIEFDFGLRTDKGPGSAYRPAFATIMYVVQHIATTIRDWRKDTLHPAMTWEYRRTRQILLSAEAISGALGSSLPGDPVLDAGKMPQTLTTLGQSAQTKHAGLLEFRRYAEAALSHQPDATPNSVIISFSVTASNLPPVAALRRHWAVMMGLSSWPRTANLLSIANRAGFVMSVRAIYLLATGEEPTDWTDKYAAPGTREIDLSAHPKHHGERFQIEVDAVLGVTRRSEPMFHSGLGGLEKAEINVTGTTLNFEIEAG